MKQQGDMGLFLISLFLYISNNFIISGPSKWLFFLKCISLKVAQISLKVAQISLSWFKSGANKSEKWRR